MSAPAGSAEQRVDRWLWFARIFKSRSLATKAVETGAVRITRSGQTIRTDKPSYTVKIGDVVTLKQRDRVRVLEVMNAGERRGPAVEAQTLYRDLSPPGSPATDDPSAVPSPRPAFKPDKRDRRALERLKGQDQFEGDD